MIINEWVTVGLRLGTNCESHACRCGATVDTLGTHAFYCKRITSRMLRHYVNDVILRSLTGAGHRCKKRFYVFYSCHVF